MNRCSILPRAAATQRGRDLDPIPPALRDSLWLGGEALVAPIPDLREMPAALDEAADPTWLSL